MSKTSGTTGSRRTKARYLTETAALTALLIVLQAVTKPAGQYVTGACVNAVLAVSALVVGLWSGVAAAVLSPVSWRYWLRAEKATAVWVSTR